MTNVKRIHKLSVKLTDKELKLLEQKAEKAGINKSDLVRRFINTGGNVSVNYEGDKIVRKMTEIQEHMNSLVHKGLNRCNEIAGRIAVLDAKFEIGMIDRNELRLAAVESRHDLETIRNDINDYRESCDKELIENVHFQGCEL